MNKIIIYYDQHCRMCQSLRKWYTQAKNRDVQVEWRHYEDAPVCGLHDHTCGESMKVQTADGKLYEAFYAVRKLVGYSRFSFIAPVLYFPGVPFLGEKAYRWVAKNRYRFGKG